MTYEEAIEYWELFNSKIDDLLYRSDGTCKKSLRKTMRASIRGK